MKKHLFKILFIFLVVSSALGYSQTLSTLDWQLIKPNESFSFRLPRGFVKRSSEGTTDTGGLYVNGQTKLTFLWGSTRSSSYDDRQKKWMNDYRETTTRIRGKRANIRSYWQCLNGTRIYRAELNVGNWQNGEVELYLGIEGRDPKIFDLANAVFSSVTFTIPTPSEGCKFRCDGLIPNSIALPIDR